MLSTVSRAFGLSEQASYRRGKASDRLGFRIAPSCTLFCLQGGRCSHRPNGRYPERWMFYDLFQCN
ncbi:unnamed protein product [Musa acuminata subsp. burmannicoides]